MKDQTPTPVRGHIAFRGDQIVATYIEDDIEEAGEPGRTFADWKARGLMRKTYEDFNEFNAVIAAAQ